MALFEDLLTVPPKELIYTVFIPFIIAFAIFWGILSALKIFDKKVNLILAFAIAFAATYYGAFGIVSTYLLNLSANLAVTAFVIIFILGIVIWSIFTLQDVFGPTDKKLMKTREKIEKLYSKLDRTHDPAKQRAIEKQIRKEEIKERLQESRDRRHR